VQFEKRCEFGELQFFVGACGVHPPIEARGDILLGAEVLSPTSRYRAVNLIDPRAGGPSMFMHFGIAIVVLVW